MIYMQDFTSNRGPLAKIWLAAHWEKKITKTHVFECNLETTIVDIISPQIKIGLRISSHLLLGVVRIYSRKAKYLLADCNEAFLKIRVAFCPGQTDLTNENLEATFKAITLPESFTDFDLQLPDVSTIEVVDHFVLNQCKSEDITMKEDYGNSHIVLESDFGNGSQQMSFHNLNIHADGFGDDGTFDFLDFTASFAEHFVSSHFSTGDSVDNIPPTPPPTAVEKEAECVKMASWPDESNGFPALEETTVVENMEEAFALEPVSIMSTSEKKRNKRKRQLLVDHEKQLSNDTIRKQLEDYAEVGTPLDMAPPTRQLMEWKETGGVFWLFCHSCVPLIHTQLQQLFPRDMFPRSWKNISGIEDQDLVEMRAQQEEGDEEVLSLDEIYHSIPSYQLDSEVSEHSIEPTPVSLPMEPKLALLDHCNMDGSDEAQVTFSNSQYEGIPAAQSSSQPPQDSQDLEEKKMNKRVQNLLHILKMHKRRGSSRCNLHELCQGGSCTHLASTLYCLLVLHKQGMLELLQEVAYGDIIVTLRPHFPHP